jgi:hypothetical protein
MNDTPERLWAKIEDGWHDSETGCEFVGGTWDAGRFQDGTECIRADLHQQALDAALAENQRLRKALHSVAYRSAAPDDLKWCQRIAKEALAKQEKDQ